MVYFNDILIYSKSLYEHVEHSRNVFVVLRKNIYRLIWKKCDFCMEKIVFPGYIVSTKGIKPDEEKVRAIQEWPSSKSITDITSFHGLISFYKRFIKYFSTLTISLIEKVKK